MSGPVHMNNTQRQLQLTWKMVNQWHVCMSQIHLRFTYWCWQCGIFCTCAPQVCLGCLRDSALMPIGTKKAPSARTVGDFRQLLVFLHISHPPAVYILVLEVQCCLHTRPSSVTVVSGGLSLGAYQHPAGTQWDPIA